jgi:hypothetical protein
MDTGPDSLEEQRYKSQKLTLKEQAQLTRKLILNEGFVTTPDDFKLESSETGIEVEFRLYTPSLYIEIRPPAKAPLFRRSVKYTMVNGSQGMLYNVNKNTVWGYITVKLDHFETWLEALKYSLHQTDDLLIVEELRKQQAGLLKKEMEKVQRYEDIIVKLKLEQKDAKELEAAVGSLNVFKEAIVNQPHSPPKPGPERVRINRRNQIKTVPYPVVLFEDKEGPVLKRASKGPPAKNLRPRRATVKK